MPQNFTDILVTTKVDLLDKAIIVLIHVEIKFNLCYDCLEAFLEQENIIWNTQAGFRKAGVLSYDSIGSFYEHFPENPY